MYVLVCTEPDVRAQDGVYTRYLTWLPGEGRYALAAHATDRQGAASVLRLRRRGELLLFLFLLFAVLLCFYEALFNLKEMHE